MVTLKDFIELDSCICGLDIDVRVNGSQLVERKTMYDWINGVRSPRLENVAQIFAALGYDSITIPLKEVEHDDLL